MKTFLQSVPLSWNTITNQTKKWSASILKNLSVFVFILAFHFSVSAQPGAALDFDGTGDYVTLPNLLPNGSYTKEAWINARTFGFTNIVSGTVSAFWAPGGNLSAGHNFANFNLQDPTPLVLGTWYHVAVTYDAGTNTMILYKNGVIVAGPAAPHPTTYGGAPFGNETEQYIGAYNNGGGPAFNWDGQIDEVRIWNVVRTQAQLVASSGCELTGDEPGLIAYYNFNQGTAGGANTGVTTLNDGSDKCTPLNNGTLVGFALTGATSNWVTPGGTVSGSCAALPNIAVNGNATCIIDGDATPAASDDTDFGTGNPVTRTFTINNTGTATLTITNVVISGVNASEFAATQPVSLTVPGGGSTTFTVTFTAATNGAKSATVTVNNDDGDEAAYDFAISASFFTLPVDMKNFNVGKAGSQSRLSWTTATETGNKGFEIQRSKDGNNWKTIGFVAGAGTTAAEQRYSYADAAPQKGRNYYRLKQLDIDNRAKFSDVRSATFADQYTLVYPVPTKDKVIVELKDQKLIGTQAVLSDLHGRVLQRINVTKMQQPVSLENFSAGIYLLRMDDGEIYKLIKQ
jgi:Concanavalin A-like lectin/glucanases superfamily/Secretion system C-terminal sorting domain/Protein of unknown function (DUF1573)